MDDSTESQAEIVQENENWHPFGCKFIPVQMSFVK